MTQEEKMLKEAVYKIATQILNESTFFEKTKPQHFGNEETPSQKVSDGSSDEQMRSNKRAIVINWLKDPKVNKAEIMRELWHPTAEEEDGKRSYFIKCLYGKKNKETGKRYRFSSKDITTLYRIKGNS